MFKDLVQGLTKLIYPPKCLRCKASITNEEVLCQDCLSLIIKNHPPFCKNCGRSISNDKISCKKCLGEDFIFEQAWGVCRYRGAIKDCIHLFKYGGKKRINKIFKALLNEFVRDYHLPLEKIDLVAPIPLHKSRLREREFNQAEILANNLSEEFGIKTESRLLKRIRNTSFQASLSKLERKKNMNNAFILNKEFSIRNKNILIVDDVFTTGTTLKEAGYILKKGGANKLYALTLAR